MKRRCKCGVMKWLCPLKGQPHTQYESLVSLAWMGNVNAQAVVIALYYEAQPS